MLMRSVTKPVAVRLTLIASVVILASAWSVRHAVADPCSSYGFPTIFCDDFETYCSPPPGGGGTCPPGSTADDTAFRNVWPADGACDPLSLPDYLATGADVRGTFGSLCVQHGPGWENPRADYVYSHVHDLRPQILAHPANTVGADSINGAGPIDKPLDGASVPPDYVDSMSRSLRPLALKGSFFFHPLDGVNKAGLANMIYYHELFLDDDRAPTDFTRSQCPTDVKTGDCNCALLNQDASCATGTCETGTCRQWYCGLDGKCEAGPRAGQACSTNADCLATCDGGPKNGQTCSTSADCGACATGPRVGANCTSNGDCGACVGGHREGETCTRDFDCQYKCGPGEQATCDSGDNKGMACTSDTECTYTYPVLRRTDGQIHASFAIGLISIYDDAPCDLDQGHFPSEWRLAVYDGKDWRTFKAPLFDIPLTSPADMMDLYPIYGWNRIDFAIGAEYIEVRITNIQSQALYSGVGACIFHTCKGGANHGGSCLTDADCGTGPSRIPNEYLVARVPRQYKGPFNKYAIGPARGRDVSDPQNPGPEKCMPALSSADIISDEIVLYDGVFAAGACCLGNGNCVPATPAACAAQQGTFQGYVECGTVPCCPDPFADADVDGDVDQTDFAVLQACFGTPSPLSNTCKCFDRDLSGSGDGDVDTDDLAAFERCASGPGIPYDPACDLPL